MLRHDDKPKCIYSLLQVQSITCDLLHTNEGTSRCEEEHTCCTQRSRLSVITANLPYKTNTSSTKTQAFQECQFKRHIALSRGVFLTIYNLSISLTRVSE